MILKRFTPALLLTVALLLLGCSSNADSATDNTARPASQIVNQRAAGETIATLATQAPALHTPQLTLTPASLGRGTASPTVVAPRTRTAAPTHTPTPAPTVPPSPTPYPALPLRDDLEPMGLQDFPRPPNDNGMGIHFVAGGYYDEQELDMQIARMKELNLKWATVVYTDENHLEIAARKFGEAGIYVVWRKTLKPYQKYFAWQRDIDIIKKYNLPPYMQLYNEAELDVEWDDHTPDRDVYLLNLITMAKDVYNAGGYPGIQLLDEDWLREFITQVYNRKGDALFHRMFFIPHAYGLNHPPDYQEDINGVLGFRAYATIFFKRLGFVPPFIIAEGGWKIDSAEDNRFPAITEELHRDYTLAVYDWFRTGTLSHGGKLPDYLFAFNMWMISGLDEAGAWYDSFRGDRTLTIEAVKKIPPFVRRFSWDP